MPRLTLILAVSILLNLGAATAYWRSRPEVPLPTATAPPTSAVSQDTSANTVTREPIWTALQPKPKSETVPTSDFVARLREAGFPVDVIRVIVRQQINAHYASREAAIVAAHATTNFWEPDFGSNAGHHQSGPERVAVRLEKNALMRQLLGDDAETPRERARRTREFGGIPIEKVDQFITLRTEYDHLRIELRKQSQGMMLPSDQAELARIRAERQQATTALFTPDELATYELHAGEPSNALREKLRWFKPSETEFLNLYASQLEFDQQFGRSALPSTREAREVWSQARAIAQRELETDFAAALTPERFAEYQLTSSSEYRQMRRITNQFELPSDLAASMTRSFSTTMSNVEAIVADASLSAEERATQIESITAQSSAAFADQLSPSARAGYELTLKQRLRRLQPRPTSPANSPGN